MRQVPDAVKRDNLYNGNSWYDAKNITWIHTDSGLHINMPIELYCYDNLKYPTFASSWNVDYFSDPFIEIKNDELFKILNLENCQCESRFMLGDLFNQRFWSTPTLEDEEPSYILVELKLQEDNSKILNGIGNKATYYKEHNDLVYAAIPLDTLEKENANKLIRLEEEYWNEKDKEYDRTTKIRKYCDDKKEEAQCILQAIQNYSNLREEFGVNRVSKIYETGTGYRTEKGNVEIDFNTNICRIDGFLFDLNKPLDEVAKEINTTFSREKFEEASRNGEELALIRANLKERGVKGSEILYGLSGGFGWKRDNKMEAPRLLIDELAKEIKGHFDELAKKLSERVIEQDKSRD